MSESGDHLDDNEFGGIASAQEATFRVFSRPGPAETGDPEIDSRLDTIFSSWAKGFREVLLVAVIARLANPGYRPYSDFYACHPRALYDYGPIRKKLTELDIPRGKSGPLNIAKGAQGLNEEWASRRRPKDAALAVVDLIKRLEANDQGWAEQIGRAMAGRFLLVARRVEALAIDLDPTTSFSALSEVAIDLITNEPDGGATAQVIIGLILDVQSASREVGVEGHQDSVSTTNTTSGKAGDIQVVGETGTPRIVEVTTKPFDSERIEDSLESVLALVEEWEEPVTSVLVLLRPEDVPEEAAQPASSLVSGTLLGTLAKDQIQYDFVDIHHWIVSQLASMTDDQRKQFHDALNAYIADPNTSERVKRHWRSLHGEG